MMPKEHTSSPGNPTSILLCVALVAVTSLARAEFVPLTRDFVVAAGARPGVTEPAVAVGSGGFFVVHSWKAERSSPRTIRALVFDRGGRRLGPGVEISASPGASHFSPTAGAFATGGAVVAYVRITPERSEVVARRLNIDGVPIGDELALSDTAIKHASGPDVAVGNDEQWTAAWIQRSDFQDCVVARRFAAADAIGAATELHCDALVRHVDVTRQDTRSAVVWSAWPSGAGGALLEGDSGDGVSFDLGGPSGSRQGEHGLAATFIEEGAIAGAWSDGEHPSGTLGVLVQNHTAAGGPEGEACVVSPGEVFVRGVDLAVPAGRRVVAWSRWTAREAFEVLLAEAAEDTCQNTAQALLAASSVEAVPVTRYQDDTMYAPSLALADDNDLFVTWEESGFRSPRRGAMGRLFRLTDSATCGDATLDGVVRASDAQRALVASVGTRWCAHRLCDTDASGAVTASDALSILRAAVGLPAALGCPPDESGATTTTLTTTTTSLPAADCFFDADCTFDPTRTRCSAEAACVACTSEYDCPFGSDCLIPDFVCAPYVPQQYQRRDEDPYPY